jgi:hypothetical protein
MNAHGKGDDFFQRVCGKIHETKLGPEKCGMTKFLAGMDVLLGLRRPKQIQPPGA